MNNKRNISLFTSKSGLTGQTISANEMLAGDANVSQMQVDITKTDNIPYFDFENSLFLDSSIKEEFAKVVKYRTSQKSVNLLNTITSNHTAILIESNCPEKNSQTVLHPEPTIFPQPVFEACNFQVKGSDNHEIEFSLDELICSGNQSMQVLSSISLEI